MSSSNLKQKAVSGVLWTSMLQFGISFISFVSNMVLARLLTPDDFGCIGVLAIFMALSNVFINGGFVSALIQKTGTTNIDYTTAFYWNVFIAFFFYFLLYGTAPFIADYFHIDRLIEILRVLGVVLIINGLCVVQSTILRKTFQFEKLTKIGLISMTVSVVIAVILAYNGLGVWSLVSLQLLSSLIKAILLWSDTKWYPSLAFSMQSFRNMFSYGSFILLSDLLNGLVENIQGIIIGRRYSSSDMGFYFQAKRLEEVPTKTISGAVSYVTFPMFSTIQNDKAVLKAAAKKSMGMMNYINFPLMMMLAVTAKPLLTTLYSDKWLNSVGYFQILCIAGLVNCMQNINYQLISAVGRSKELFRWNIVKRVSGIMFVVIGMNWGIYGILWGMVVSSYFAYMVDAILASKSTDYTFPQQIRDASPLFMLTIVPTLLAFFASMIPVHYILLLSIQIAIFLISYLLLSYIFRIKEYDETIMMALNYISKFKKNDRQ